MALKALCRICARFLLLATKLTLKVALRVSFSFLPNYLKKTTKIILRVLYAFAKTLKVGRRSLLRSPGVLARITMVNRAVGDQRETVFTAGIEPPARQSHLRCVLAFMPTLTRAFQSDLESRRIGRCVLSRLFPQAAYDV